MKRVIPILAAMAMAIPTIQSHAESVTSVNAVGMVRRNVEPNGFTFISIPFNPVEEGTVGLNDIIGDQLTGSSNALGSDKIIVWNPNTQAYENFWKVENTGNVDFDGKWFKVDGAFPPNPAEIELGPGNGIWIQSLRSDVQTVLLSGEVPDNVIDVTLFSGFTQVGFPYPAEREINDSDLADAATGATNALNSDKIILWDMETQSYTSLWLVDGTGNETFDGKWHYVDGAFPPNVADITLTPADGFWFQKLQQGSSTWSPVKPYSWPGE